MNFIISIITLGLFTIVYILDSIFKLFYQVNKRQWYKLFSQRSIDKSYKIDVLGNYVFADFWNFCLSSSGYKFGVFGETLSSCFGKKLEEKSLTIVGYIIAYAIDMFDFTKWTCGGHCKNAIMTEEEIKDFLNK